jgi:Protein of unknown function (DUF4199)
MKRTVWTFGIISGLILSVMMSVTIPFQAQIGFDRGEVIGYATMLAAFLLIFFGVRSYRDNVAGGSIRFGRAFAVGVLIALIASVMYTATWEVIYFGFQQDFAEKYTAHQIEGLRAKGATQAELDKSVEDGKKFAAMYKNPVMNAAITMLEPLPLGLVVALISAGVMSRRRRSGGVVVAVS